MKEDTRVYIVAMPNPDEFFPHNTEMPKRIDRELNHALGTGYIPHYADLPTMKVIGVCGCLFFR